ncbi:MAG: glycosyltransferase family 39 protein [Microgenomates group bacterium]
MIIIIAILGLILRLVLANQSFWLDEGASLMAARIPLAQFFEYLKADFHPPLYYLFLKLWLPLAGNTEWLIRLPDILIGTASIYLVYLLSKSIFGNNSKLPLLMAILLSLNPFHIYYTQELRMYNFSTFFVLLSWLALLKNKYLFVGIANFLSIFTFYGAGFNFVSQGLYLLFSNRKNIWRYLTSFLPTVLGFIFWWPIFSIQLSGGDFMQNSLPGWNLLSGSATAKSFLLIPIKFIIGRVNLEPQSLYFAVGGLLLVIFSCLILLSLKDKKSKPLWFFFLTPLVLATLISFKTPILGYWRYLFLLPPFLMLLAAGVWQLPRRLRTLAITFISLVFVSANIYFWVSPRFQREDWRGFTSMINGKQALVILPFSGVFAPLTFYQTDAFYYPAQQNLGKTDADISAKLLPLTKKYQTIYVMEYLSDLSDPNRKILNTVRELKQKEKAVYNFNNLGQVYEF